jgi:hypothetical protein
MGSGGKMVKVTGPNQSVSFSVAGLGAVASIDFSDCYLSITQLQ